MDECVNCLEAMVDHKVTKWKEVEHQSMYDNHLWIIVDITPNLKIVLKIVGGNCIFIVKTYIDR